MTIPDPVALIIDLLRADAQVGALAGDSVFGGGLPDSGGPAMPGAAVVVSPAGGPGRHGVQGWRRNRIDTTCYGASLEDAWNLHLAVREALESARQAAPLLSVETLSDGANALDPTTLWPTCYASYRVLTSVAA